MMITEGDREFARLIADRVARLTHETTDPLRWAADVSAHKGAPDRAAGMIGQMRTALAPVLRHERQPDAAMRLQCARVYLHWLWGV